MPHLRETVENGTTFRGELPRCERLEAKFQEGVAEETGDVWYEKKKALDSIYLRTVIWLREFSGWHQRTESDLVGEGHSHEDSVMVPVAWWGWK